PYLGRYEASAFIFMSGTPYNLLYPEQKVDVLSIDRSDLIDPLQYSMTDLSNLTYWCTGWDGRVRGIGAGFTQGFREVVNAQGNICLKLLRMRATGTAGMSAGHFGQNSQPAGYRAFAFELRNLFMLDSVQMELPPHYSLSGARISLRHVRNWGSGDFPSEPQRDFPAYQMDVHSGYVTFRFHDWVEQWVTEPVLNGNGQANNAVFASFFDETKRYTLVVDLLTDDCTVNVDSTVPLSVSSWYHNNPLQQSPVTNQIQFDLERNTPDFATNATNFQIDNQADLSFDFSIVPNGIGW
ncbi:MAG: hypothetical protein AAGB22_14900, partial [Bacteroidota bacterium]